MTPLIFADRNVKLRMINNKKTYLPLQTDALSLLTVKRTYVFRPSRFLCLEVSIARTHASRIKRFPVLSLRVKFFVGAFKFDI